MKRFLIISTVMWSAACLSLSVEAANVAFDSAADPVYNDGWQSGDNGGFGFMPWTLIEFGTQSGHIIASSTGNGDGIDDGTTRGAANDRDIDTAGRSWGTYAFIDSDGDATGALRELTGGPLAIGQSLFVDMDNGEINQQGLNSVNIQFLVPDGNEVWFRFEGGDTNYEVFSNNLSTYTPTTLGFADEGMTVQLTRTAFDTLDLTATLRNGDSQTLPLTMTGLDGAAIYAIFLNNDSAGIGASNEAYFNSIRVDGVPEPGTLVLALSAAAAALFRRRKFSS
jgi:hypothetical protein